MSVKALIFDLYGTLIRIHTDEESIEHLWKPLSYFYGYHGAYYTPEALLDSYRHLIAKEERKAQKKIQNRSGRNKTGKGFQRTFYPKRCKSIFTNGTVYSPILQSLFHKSFRTVSRSTGYVLPSETTGCTNILAVQCPKDFYRTGNETARDLRIF